MRPMNTKSVIETSLKDAIRSKDDRRKNVFRMLLAAVRMAEIDNKAPLDEAEVLAIVQKEVKSRREVIADAQRAGRDDLIAEAEAEKSLLEELLPKPMTEAEIMELARQAVAESGATSLREMGQVMKILMPRIQGRASGEQVSQTVRQLLQ